jgi:hypothetical protein
MPLGFLDTISVVYFSGHYVYKFMSVDNYLPVTVQYLSFLFGQILYTCLAEGALAFSGA